MQDPEIVKFEFPDSKNVRTAEPANATGPNIQRRDKKPSAQFRWPIERGVTVRPSKRLGPNFTS